MIQHDYPELESEASDEDRVPVRGEDLPELPTLEAYHGIAGEFVELVDPHTEAHPVAILVQFLVAVGNMIGRVPYFEVDGSRHYLNENVALVGPTASGRKGTSWAQVRRLLESVDLDWLSRRVVDGLSSGEGLIFAVRDEVRREEDGTEVVVDQGEPDKRLLVVEGEFARPLQTLVRDGCTLSAVLRGAWDSGTLRVLTKNSPIKATGAHISTIAHITKTELLKLLGSNEAGNGFANRILWVVAWRTKVLPDGGCLTDAELAPFAARVAQVVVAARRVCRMERDEAARSLWHERYEGLTEVRPGLLGAMTGRAAPHVVRLSCIYAVLDGSAVVRVAHLRAALALWDYCERSARFVFGAALGDPVADAILRELRRRNGEGLTRRQINVDVFQRHRSSAEIRKALGSLLDLGLASRTREKGTGGRDAERWFAVVPGLRPAANEGANNGAN